MMSMSLKLEVGALQRLRDGLDRADAHDLRRDARDRHREHARLRRMPSSLAFSADISTAAEAPSLSGLLLPAVTVPPAMKAGCSAASASSEVSRRGPSSVVNIVPSGSVHRDDLAGEDAAIHRAAIARWWLRSAKASCSSRLMLYCLRQVLRRHAHRDVGLVEGGASACPAGHRSRCRSGC